MCCLYYWDLCVYYSHEHVKFSLYQLPFVVSKVHLRIPKTLSDMRTEHERKSWTHLRRCTEGQADCWSSCCSRLHFEGCSLFPTQHTPPSFPKHTTATVTHTLHILNRAKILDSQPRVASGTFIQLRCDLWEIFLSGNSFYTPRGTEGGRSCKDTIKGAMGGTVGWCDRVEREMARRGIKGSENVSKRRWQQEGGLQGEKGGKRREGGGGGWTSGVWLAGEMFGRCREGEKTGATHTYGHTFCALSEPLMTCLIFSIFLPLSIDVAFPPPI